MDENAICELSKKFEIGGHTLTHARLFSLISWIGAYCPDDIFKLIDFYLGQVAKDGGCFHLWGHSREIEEYDLWNKLEMIFNRMSIINEIRYIQNKDLA